MGYLVKTGTLKSHSHKLTSLKKYQFGGSKVHPKTLENFKNILPNVLTSNTYGKFN